MKTREMLSAIAVATVALAPVAAQAGTRASVDGVGETLDLHSALTVSQKNKAGPGTGGVVSGLALLGVGGGIIALIASNGHSNHNTGSGGS